MSTEWDRRGNRLQGKSKKTELSDTDLNEFVDRAEDSISFFGKYFCSMEITPKQAKMAHLLNTQPRVVAVFNRQGGKSTILALYDVHELAFRKYTDGSEDFTILFAPIKDQARIIFSKVESFIKNNVYLSELIDKFQTGGTIRMKNGNELQAKTASPNSHIRGFSPKKIQIDESQDVSDVKYYEDILPSGAATNAKIQEIGTPAKRNHFYKTFYHDSSFKKVKQIWTQCPFIAKEYIQSLLDSGKMTKARFDQEFNCVWNVDAASAWSFKMIQKTCVLEEKYYPPIGNLHYYAGIDIGKHPAQTVLSIYENKGDELNQVLLQRFNPVSFKEIVNKVYAPLCTYEPLTCVDATSGSQGQVIFEMLQDKFNADGNYKMMGNLIPEDYTSSSKIKSEMANELELMAENSMLRLFNNAAQRRQMIAYEKKTNPSGNTVYYSEELTDICQADMLGVRAYKGHSYANQQFQFAASGKVSGLSGGSMPSFIQDIKGVNRPDW